MAKGKAGAELNRRLRGEDRLLQPVRKHADDGESVVCVRILLIQMDSPQRGLQTFLPVRRWIVGPSIRNQSDIDSRTPNVGLGKLRIEPTGFPEQLPGLEVRWPRNLMKAPSSLSDQVPGGHVASVPRQREIRFRLEQFRLYGSGNPLGYLVLN